jgi:hypothetical protein
MGIKIGNNNRINDSIIMENSNKSEKKNFCEKHPILVAIFASVVAGVILLFSFWEKIVSAVEGIIK